MRDVGMSLVDYPSDSSSDDQELPATKKQKIPSKSLPPLPPGFRDLYATPIRTSKVDDPSLHDGRKRAIPHVDGNWPTHVYTEWNPTEEERLSIDRLIRFSYPDQQELHSLLLTDLGAPAPLHISLSSSLGIQSKHRDHFTHALRSHIEKANVSAFEVTAVGLRWVSNFNETRWFLVLQLDHPSKDELNRLLDACNQTATSFGYSTLYSNPHTKLLNAPTESNTIANQSGIEDPPVNVVVNGDLPVATKMANPFHISVAWSLSKPPATKTSHLTGEVNPDTPQIQPRLEIVVDSIKVKSGNTILTLPLKPAPSQRISIEPTKIE